jgi:threonyl-tRNA synthetase
MLVIGDREMENGEAAVRSRKNGDMGAMKADAIIAMLTDEINSKLL